MPAIAAAVLAAGTVLSLTIWAAGRRVTDADRVAARLSQYGSPIEVAPPRVRTGNPLRDALRQPRRVSRRSRRVVAGERVLPALPPVTPLPRIQQPARRHHHPAQQCAQGRLLLRAGAEL